MGQTLLRSNVAECVFLVWAADRRSGKGRKEKMLLGVFVLCVGKVGGVSSEGEGKDC